MKMTKEERELRKVLNKRLPYGLAADYKRLITAMRNAVIEEVLLRISHYYSGSERICEEIRKEMG